MDKEEQVMDKEEEVFLDKEEERMHIEIYWAKIEEGEEMKMGTKTLWDKEGNLNCSDREWGRCDTS